MPELIRGDAEGEGGRAGRRGAGGGAGSAPPGAPSGGGGGGGGGGAPSRQDFRRGRRTEKSRNPSQRLKEALGRITAASAFASAPERSLWNPDAAFAASSADQGAWVFGVFR